MKSFLAVCLCLPMPAFSLRTATAELNSPASPPLKLKVATVMNTPGCVAFWDFVKREPDGAHRFTAHVPPGATNDFALDAANYIKDYWGEGRAATYADFPLLGRGPFGQAIRVRKEEDKTFMSYSGWKGGEKYETVSQRRARKPELLIEHAVKGMLPKGRLGRSLNTKLKVYAGDKHPHAAQLPAALVIKKK